MGSPKEVREKRGERREEGRGGARRRGKEAESIIST